MKKFFYCLLLLTGFLTAHGQTLPTFSTDGAETWYFVQFKNGKAVLGDQGDGILRTELAQKNQLQESPQLWKLVGTKDNFELISKEGRHVYYNGTSFSNDSRFAASVVQTGKLKLVTTTSTTYRPGWEISASQISDRGMNQWQGAGVGKQLGAWYLGDNNNPIDFVTEDGAPLNGGDPTFSTTDREVWYYVAFKNKGTGNVQAYLTDRGEGAPLQTATKISPRTYKGQLWKLVGAQGAFELVNASGRKVYYNTTTQRFTTGSTDGNLRLVVSGNTDYAPAWEISNSTLSNKAMNQFGGAGVGRELGAWNSNDVNNPLVFIPENDFQFPDVLPVALPEYTYTSDNSYRPVNKNTLWYKHPAISPQRSSANPWMEYGLPIGDGQFGAMMFGGVRQDLLQFNEKTLWSGSKTAYGYYLNFGHLYMEDLSGATSVSDYVRYLDLETATAGMQYTHNGTKYTRQYIASHPARTIAVRLKAEGTGTISQKFYLYNANGAPATYSNDGTGLFQGQSDLVSFEARIRVVHTGGTMTADSTGITVQGASEVVVYLVGGTNFDETNSDFISGDAGTIRNTLTTRIEAAASQTWDALYAAHVADHKGLYDRVKFDLPSATNEIETYELVNTYNSSPTQAQRQMLELLYFNYGRYLLIASSRGVNLPNNLQGIWNNSNTPPWHSDIHANINVQMNYWPAESMNLSELHKPFLNYVHNMAINHPQWKQYARNSGQSKGWTCYTENSIFGSYGTFQMNYVIANAWYCAHMWQHYRYTQDKTYLKDVALPVMVSCAEYWMERLIPERRNNEDVLVAPNEYSPEHGPTSEDGVAHAQQLIWDLFNNTLQAIEALGAEAGVSETFKTDLQNKFNKLDPGLAIENDPDNGRPLLREWKYSTVTAGERTHRHMSHMMALHPLNQISPSSEYFRPLINSLDRRTDASTGWSMGWKINLWARALDGDRAHSILRTALKHSTSYGTNAGAGGIYYNLFDSHAPFQIDGNFGATAGVGEMLLQSQHDTIQILPALPTAWANGSIKGLRATNNFGVDIAWANGKLQSFSISSGSGKECVVSYPNIATYGKFYDANGVELTATVVNNNAVKLPIATGAVVTFRASESASIGGVEASQAGISVKGYTVTVAGKGTNKVYDLQGRLLLNTEKSVFTLPELVGKVVLVTNTDGANSKTYKVTLGK